MKGFTIAIFLTFSQIPGVMPKRPYAVIVNQNEYRRR